MEFTKYYSCIEFKKISDICIIDYPIQSNNIDYDSFKNKSKIIILTIQHNKYFEFILHTILPKLSVPFIIISSFDDYTFPDEFDTNIINSITNNQYFKHWFPINKSIPDDSKFTSIFYGMDYVKLQADHSIDFRLLTSYQQDSIFQNIINKSKQFIHRIPKIHCSFHLNCTDGRHGNWRSRLHYIIPNDITFFEQGNLERPKMWENTSQYAFCLSPHGNGLDCIRTIEALCLGCIVIIKTSPLDKLYEDLPVLIVNEYTDINEKLLNDTIIVFSQKSFNYKKLTMQYWIDLVNNKF